MYNNEHFVIFYNMHRSNSELLTGGGCGKLTFIRQRTNFIKSKYFY